MNMSPTLTASQPNAHLHSHPFTSSDQKHNTNIQHKLSSFTNASIFYYSHLLKLIISLFFLEYLKLRRS